MKALIVIEAPEADLNKARHALYQGMFIAFQANLEATLLVLGSVEKDLQNELDSTGVAKVICLKSSINTRDSSAVADAIDNMSSLAGDDYIVVGSPSFVLRDAFGRLSVRNNAQVITGVTSLSYSTTGSFDLKTAFDGGTQAAHVQVDAGTLLYCLLDPSVSTKVEHDGRKDKTIQFFTCSTPNVDSRISIVSQTTLESHDDNGELNLGTARVVVAGGRGVGSKNAMQELEKWTQSIGAAFGSSRAPVEAQWVSYDRLIGQTGTAISPDVYIAMGVSGAPQHLSGVRQAKRIVAINNDPMAPIAEEADLFIVADVNDIFSHL